MPDQQQEEFLRIVSRYLDGSATLEEIHLLDHYYELFRDEPAVTDRLGDAEMRALEQRMEERLFERIGEPARQRRLWPRIAAAASIIMAVSAGTYFILHKKQPGQQTAQNQNDLVPGSNKAILKMANGKQVVITGAKNGLLAQQGSITITKTADGKLTYTNSGTNNGTMLYDTLIVPRGGQHQVRFSDGSIAYLNADSKLRIPENFEKSDRTVELISGEADFQVVYNNKSPFRVKVKGQITEDIGTEFNINAYPDEATIKTTLLEGAIKVFSKSKTYILKPGQEAALNTSSNTIQVHNVDTDEAFAWKDGYFMFHQADIGTMMRQLERWYDVDVAYEGQTPSVKITGKVHRNVNASQALKILTYLDIHYRIEGKKIIITP